MIGLIVVIIFVALDTVFYCFSNLDGRTSSGWYKFPGGGFIAFLKFGKTKL